ncbi:TIGR03016 family PEP-CTERM system-associated outer membrane protein [Alteromonas oceanisediminis]|uniref:TIGR03016 family PEP-CTERM system-associated outer membrane protein n=1 Tax=Alteromonas oceanisediminis TaxID=2836180 RepID=UPI001BDAC2B9|nr:TIGR03016 family PEP-CTERM system-associated outer membrane protein [Alteromonas oceanisediminis]MBT0585657.1 TIGR03016 family PEP-CTERM system-associated outer membrane protein [Alteromonas oceanisediminis]
MYLSKRSAKYSLASVGLTLIATTMWHTGVSANIESEVGLRTSIVATDGRSDGTRRINGETTALNINPSILLSYQGPIASAVWNIDHSYIYQDIDATDRSTERSFTEYNFDSNVNIIDNYLQFSYNSQLRFRNTDPSQVFANDFISGSDSLSRIRTNSASLQFVTPNPRWVAINWQLSGAKVESDRNINSERNLDNNNLATFFTLRQGEEFRRVRWAVNNQWQKTEGNRTRGDITSRSVAGELSVGLFSKVSLITNVQDERNQYSNTITNDSAGSREFTSYGAGLEWYASDNRRISVQYNETESDDAEQDNESFISFDVIWAFSQRTRLEASYGRRFFGEAGDFLFVYNTRHLRLSASYNEELTTFTRLVSNFENLGVFVCPVGSNQASDCFLPNTLAYELQPDEQFNAFFQNIPEISEELILRRTGSLNFGFETRKVTVSTSIGGGVTEFLETDREQNNLTASVNIDYRVGVKTSIFSNNNFNRTDFVDRDDRNDVIRADLGIRHSWSRHLSTSTEISYIDRDSDNESNQYQERRLTLALDYQF